MWNQRGTTVEGQEGNVGCTDQERYEVEWVWAQEFTRIDWHVEISYW